VAKGRKATRNFPDKLVDTIESALDSAFEPGDWVTDYIAPFIYLSEAVHTHPQHDRMVELICNTLIEQPGVVAAYPVKDFQGAEDESWDRLKRAAYLSTDPERAGDIFVVPARYTITDVDIVRGFGTNHGTPWEYDQQVPVLVVAKRISPNRNSKPVDQRRIAPTIAALLGVAPPKTAALPPLPGIL
jgi:hypothetical protein